MNYIYDIMLNYCDKLYDFYEWNLEDELTHIRKIPLVKVSSDVLMDFRDFEVRVSDDFLQKIYNKTEIFGKQGIRVSKYSFLISDGKDIFALKLNDKGYVVKKSRLVVDEEVDSLEIVRNARHIDILYSKGKKNISDCFKTREEIKKEDYIYSELDRLVLKRDTEKLKYLYLECFNKKEDDESKIVSDIKNKLVTDFDNIYLDIYNFFKLTSIKNSH